MARKVAIKTADLIPENIIIPAGTVSVEEQPPKRKRGRPPKSAGSSPKPPPKKKRKYKKRQKEEPDGIKHLCTCCGMVYDKLEGNFWKSSSSPLFEGNKGYIHICASCIKRLFNEWKVKLQDERMAYMCLCYFTDKYFSEDLYISLCNEPSFNVGKYFQCTSIKQYRDKTFYNTLVELIRDGRHTLDEVRTTSEERWKKDTLKNKLEVIRIVGYDCFDDENYSETERKWLFNTAKTYLNDDVSDDAHKVQQIIAMVKTMLQNERIDRRIQQEFVANNSNDSAIVKDLTNIKSTLIKSINSIALDNGISEKSGKTERKANTLSGIMKEMENNDYQEIKVNVVSAKMSKSYAEIAKANAKALMDELNLTSDDYARMVATQAKMIEDLQKENETLEERRRKLTLQVKKLEKQLGEYENGGDDEDDNLFSEN